MKPIPFQDLVRRFYSGESFVVFDTETTGLNTFHDDIIEIAGLIWEKGKEPKTFQELMKVNPNKITPGAWEVHQIPAEEIESARSPKEVLSDFIRFCGDRALIAHNVKFDYDMLNSNLIQHGMKPYQNEETACTVGYAREQMMPAKLIEVARHWGVEFEGDQFHRALYDVRVLTEILNRMMKKHEPEELQYSLIF
ncbi:hypothetical protein COY07_00695 [Candidatus Peregrinibacteria bacterium CG_4_10_14_0_2_um_filter_43_11]|nr:MAG: hypothetical protein COY07_00695 [Candidatus Peregrinibacteria bacterium CG_4_10_14_0_2_um_filter_43_11]